MIFYYVRYQPTSANYILLYPWQIILIYSVHLFLATVLLIQLACGCPPNEGIKDPADFNFDGPMRNQKWQMKSFH